MAATRLIALHKNKGKSVAACLKSRTDYVQNPDKTEHGELISSYEYCLIHLSDFSTVFAKVRKNHLSSHNPGNTIFRPVSDQLAKVFDFEIIFLKNLCTDFR